MESYPADIELKLGFDVVRRSIEGRLQTAVGLRAVLSEVPSSDFATVSATLEAVSEWQDALRSGQAPGLSGLPDLAVPLRDCSPEGSWLEPPAILDVIASLSLARQVHRYFAGQADRFPTLATKCAEIFSNDELEKALSRIVDDQGNVRDDASPDLRRIRKSMRGQEGSIRAAAERAMKAARDGGYDAGEAPTVRGGRMVIPVRADERRKLPGSIVDTSSSGKTAFIEPEDCLQLSNELRLIEAQERREIVRILISATDDIRIVADALLHNQQLLALQDVLRAKAHLANELDAKVPEIGDGTTIRVEKAVNPALLLLRKQGSQRGAVTKPVVPLDLVLEPPDRTLVISGPNAGGKSVAMKTMGLLSLMLSHGIPTPCSEGSIVPLFDRVLVAFGDDQSLENDLSTFSSHIESLRRIVERAGPNTLILIDEIGTGTDPAAGEAIARAVLEYLSEQGGFTIVTTHFGGLKALAHDSPGMINGAMRFDPDRLEPTYVFEPGIPGSSYALEIAERADFPDFLLKKAHENFGAERTRIEELILELSQARQDAERTSTELKSRLQKTEAAEKEHRDAKAGLEEARGAVLRQAHEKAEQLLREANRAIERTIREIKESQADKSRTKTARAELGEFQQKVHAAKPKQPEVEKPRVSPTDEDRSIGVGDSVVLDNGTAVGNVIRVEGDQVVVAFELAQMRVDSTRVHRVSAPKKSTRSQVRSTPPPSLSIAQRIDLRGYHVAEALPIVDRFLDDAMRAGLSRVELLHGTGTGALREAVRDHLGSMVEVVSMEDAPVDQGGAGVTYVFLS